MSLFGDENDDTPSSPSHRRATSKSLFSDNPQSTPRKATNSLFADAETHDDDDNWGFTPTRKAARVTARTLLAGADVPEQYDTIWQSLASHEEVVGRGDLKDILSEANVQSEATEAIFKVLGGGKEFGQGEFNVFLALVGLAQEREDVTLDGVDERKSRLPIPNIGKFDPKKNVPVEEHVPTPQETSPAASQTSSKIVAKRASTTSFPDTDPWASPEMHKGHNHDQNGAGARMAVPDGPVRTTSAYSASSQTASEVPPISPPVRESTTTSWGAFGASPATTFPDHGLGAGGFGQPPGESGNSSDPTGLGAPLPRSLGSGPDEVVTITTLQEKEGMFLFQHRNYQVTSARRNSKVIRRYSDFTWLLDCLHKKYPYRQLPLLPPKRVASKSNTHSPFLSNNPS
jgi:sorting nexin-8